MTIRILLVDDNPTFLAAVSQFLGTLPAIQVIGQVHDGCEALVKAALLQPDLVLLDVSMPGMNGLEVARRLQNWPQPPFVVFLTMHDSADYRAAAADLGAVGFVGKDALAIDLPPIIERLLTLQSDRNT